MWPVNLGTARIVVIVALVVAGVAVLANGFSDAGTTLAAPSGGGVTTTPPASSPPGSTQTSTPTQTPKPQPPKDVVVMVFNGTNAAGLAAQAQQILTDDGYAAPYDPLDSPVPGIPKTTVYFRSGPDARQNTSDASALADALIKGAKVEQLGADYIDHVESDVNVVVVLGQDYADANA